MEVRARHLLIGVFVLAMIAVGFGFVYWLNNAAGLGERTTYRIQFEGAASGLRPGSAVLFNGIRVGEVTQLTLNRDEPRQVMATIVIERATPVRSDTQVGIEVQGLMGAPVVALKGGDPKAPALAAQRGRIPMLTADRAASQDTMQTAREVLRRIDDILSENAEPLRSAIANINTFSAALARNSDRLDTIVDGLARMLAGPEKKTPTIYELAAARDFPALPSLPSGQLAIPEPTAVLAFDTQRILTRSGTAESPSFADAQWSDNIPKLLQARIIQSFENAKYMRVARASEAFTADRQLLIDLRQFQLSLSPAAMADIEFSAKIVADGRVIDARIFKASVPVEKIEVRAVTEALGEAFRQAAKELVLWVVAAN